MAALRKRTAKKEVDLDEMVASGSTGAYEALQLYKSRAMRQKSKEDAIGALKTVAGGAKALLKHNYQTAGSELTNLFLTLVLELNFDLTEELRGYVLDINEAFPKNSPAQIDFLKGAVKWTISCGRRELGDTQLQTKLGEVLWDTKDKSATSHFAAGEAPGALCDKIFATFTEQNQQSQRDQAFTLGIVNFLALENMRDANELNIQYRRLSKSHNKNHHVTSRLVTFVDYLLQTCRRDAAPLFKTLVNSYAGDLDFDDNVPTLLMGPIAIRLFGIQPKVNPMMSMLQSMIA